MEWNVGAFIVCSYAGSVNTRVKFCQSWARFLHLLVKTCKCMCEGWNRGVRVRARALAGHISPVSDWPWNLAPYSSTRSFIHLLHWPPHVPLPHLPSGILRGKRREASGFVCVCVCFTGFDDRTVHTLNSFDLLVPFECSPSTKLLLFENWSSKMFFLLCREVSEYCSFSTLISIYYRIRVISPPPQDENFHTFFYTEGGKPPVVNLCSGFCVSTAVFNYRYT